MAYAWSCSTCRTRAIVACCRRAVPATSHTRRRCLPPPACRCARGIVDRDRRESSRRMSSTAASHPLIVKPAFDDASGGIDAGSAVRNADASTRASRWSSASTRCPRWSKSSSRAAQIRICAAHRQRSAPARFRFSAMQFKLRHLDNERSHAARRIITYRAKWDPYSRDSLRDGEQKRPVDDLASSSLVVEHHPSIAARARLTRSVVATTLCVDAARRSQDQPSLHTSSRSIPTPTSRRDGCAFAQCVQRQRRIHVRTSDPADRRMHPLSARPHVPSANRLRRRRLLRQYLAQRKFRPARLTISYICREKLRVPSALKG